MITTADAVQSLRPGAQWTMSGDDVASIVWHDGSGPLTQEAVDSERLRLQQLADEAAATAAANGAAAIAHAKSLGFTDAMISAMYPALVAPVAP